MTERVTVGEGDVQGNGGSGGSAISADGRFVAFSSEATNLVPGDTNGFVDEFVRDRQSRKTWRVSKGQHGAQGNGRTYGSVLSANARFVVFSSDASNLVSGDRNGVTDVFVHDRLMDTTQRVSLSRSNAEPNGSSTVAAVSGDGRFVVFISDATNLVPGDTNGVVDVFVRDRQTKDTQRVSLGQGGVQGNDSSGMGGGSSISADGHFVTFVSEATNLVAGDTNGESDVFIRDVRLRTTKRVSVGSRGVQANRFGCCSVVSANGRFVLFSSDADNLVAGDTNGLVDVFVRTLAP